MSKRGLFRYCMAVTAIVLGAAWASGASAEKTRLTVYTALENDQLQPFKQAFEADNPDIEIAWVRDSTGVITARFLAEKDNPRADIVWGLAASSLLVFDQQNLLHGYTPKGAEALKPNFHSAKTPMTWTGMDAFLSIVCFNTVEAAKSKIPQPTSWKDLIKPEFKGSVVMPHPASSGTGYLVVAAWLQLMGEEEGWKFMDALHQNIAVYTHSGSAPCVQAARGERVAGISLDMRGAREKTQGAPIEVVVPKEGLGWDMEATGIVQGTKNLAAAQKLADWAVTRKANELYSKYYAVTALPGVASQPANYPKGAEAAMVKNDFGWMASNRERILAEWSRRYESKAAPR